MFKKAAFVAHMLTLCCHVAAKRSCSLDISFLIILLCSNSRDSLVAIALCFKAQRHMIKSPQLHPNFNYCGQNTQFPANYISGARYV